MDMNTCKCGNCGKSVNKCSCGSCSQVKNPQNDGQDCNTQQKNC